MFAKTSDFVRCRCRRGFAVVGTAALALSLPVVSHAQAVDVSAIVQEIQGQRAAILAVGAAVFTVLLAGAMFSWLRRAV